EKPIRRLYCDDYSDPKYEFYNIEKLFYHFSEMITQKKLVIGHNITKFDLEVLTGQFNEQNLLNTVHKDDIPSVLTSAMFIADTITGFGRRVSLNDLAESVLGRGKTGNGALAPLKWREGKYSEVIEYCDNDVQLTADIYRHYLKDGYVMFKGRRYWTGWRA
ncbi:MAG: 3'-5' exonuclease family protein, partial [Bacillati bacterium]